MKPIHKFNGGRGATLCHKCSVIIFEGLTEDLYCEKCKQKQNLIDIMQEDEKLGLYEEKSEKPILLEEANKEILLEDIFNDEKREGVKRVIKQHKVLKGLTLINPLHLQMTESGYGEFPDSYKLTEKGIQYIIEKLNKE